MNDAQALQLCVLPSPATNDFEVRLFVDGDDLIRRHWPDMMGMDPDDVLSREVLAPGELPHRETVARCRCGVSGCGSVEVVIRGSEDRVIWDSWSYAGD